MEGIKWLFFDMGSTLIDERIPYEYRLRKIAALSGVSYENVYEGAMELYRQNRKGDLEIAKKYGVPVPAWNPEGEILYTDAAKCLGILSRKYRLGIIANQRPGTEERLKNYGVLKYLDLVVASAEEGVSKPDRRIFDMALQRSQCKPQQAVMIGDRIDNDIVPARLLGMYTIWIRQGFGQYWRIEREIERPDYAVNHLMEICNIL